MFTVFEVSKNVKSVFLTDIEENGKRYVVCTTKGTKGTKGTKRKANPCPVHETPPTKKAKAKRAKNSTLSPPKLDDDTDTHSDYTDSPKLETVSDLKKLKARALKKILVANGASPYGKKSTLRDRIVNLKCLELKEEDDSFEPHQPSTPEESH